MYSIGQFARIGRVSAKTLRFYDEVGLLKPARVDRENQYRYYAPEQVRDLLLIGELKGFGFALEEIRLLLPARAPAQLKGALERRLAELDEQIAAQERARAALAARIKRLSEGGALMETMTYRVELKDQEPVLAATLRRRIAISRVSALFGELFSRLADAGLKPAGPALALYHGEDYNPEDVDLEIGAPISRAAGAPGLTVREIAGGPHAATLHVGPFHGVGSAYAALFAWIEVSGYACGGPAREVYLVGPDQTPDEGRFVTAVSLPLVRVAGSE